ncbi:monocarboxylate transporter 12-like [Amphiura filiformis]|uniref:monocarboxylate transporter 12-like n=1 Tax=Amphiura filiformis TaxID=82378 RepID=UPI003B226BA5
MIQELDLRIPIQDYSLNSTLNLKEVANPGEQATMNAVIFELLEKTKFFGRFVIFFLSVGIHKSFGVLLPYLVAGLDTDVAMVGWAYGFYGGLLFLIGPISGALTLYYGARSVCIVGGVLAAIGIIMSSSVASPIQFCSSLDWAWANNTAKYPTSLRQLPDSFALANGISISGASFGMMVIPPMAERLVEEYGWRGAVLLIGAIDAHMVFAASLLKSSKHESTKKGYLRMNDNDSKDIETRSLKDILLASLDVKLFALEPLIIFYDIIIFFFIIIYSAWTVFLVPHAIVRGISPINAAYLSTVAGLCNLFGRIAYAPIIDKGIMDSRDMFALLSALNAGLFIFDSYFNTYTLMSFSAAVAGFVIGAGNSVWTMIIKQFVDECSVGTFIGALGWTHLFSGIGSMISSPLVGLSYDRLQSYDLVFLMMGIISALTCLFLGAVRVIHKYVA